MRSSLVGLGLLAAVSVAPFFACAPASPTANDEGPTTKKRVDWGACASCHQDEFDHARHHPGEKPITCAVCHQPDRWSPQLLNHPWPLTGKHEKTACFDCHKVDRKMMRGLKKDCVSCHRAEYEKAPDHLAHFAVTCEQCHTTSAWKPLVAQPVWPKEPEPEPPPTASAAPSASTAPSSKPKPRVAPPKPTPKPVPQPTVDPTSGASRRR